jgi:hypothetical protein
VILVAKASATASANSASLIKALVDAGVSHTWGAAVVGVIAVFETFRRPIPDPNMVVVAVVAFYLHRRLVHLFTSHDYAGVLRSAEDVVDTDDRLLIAVLGIAY